MNASRPLENSGLKIAPLALGGNVFGWTCDERASREILDAFLDAGLNCVDTADMYSRWVPGHVGGESETIIGNWFTARKNRDRVILATKVGMDMGEGKIGLAKKYIFQAVEDSLRRLRTDYIDLYQSHKDDPATPLEETLDAFATLVKQGKVKAIGASNYSGERLAEALRVSQDRGYPRYETLQPLYNLCDRAEYEQTLAPVCQTAGLAVITYFSLAAGFLTGKYRSAQDLAGRARSRTVEKYLNPRGMKILAALDSVAQRLGSRPTQVALAWLIAQPSVTAPIASATSLAQLQDLIAATRLTLDRDALRLLDEASAEPATK